MPTILITGGTGLVGKALTTFLLSKGYQVIVLSRNKKERNQNTNLTYAIWDVTNQKIDIEAVQKADCIIHLAGAGVMDKKWTAEYKKEIVDSRVKSSELLVTTLKNNPHKVKAIVSASAIGFYGEDKIPNYSFTEDDKPDNGFLGNTCQLWEDGIEPATALGIRICKLRIGIVFSKAGGAFAEFVKPLKFKLATILGNGKQVISWIHIDDLCRQFLFAIENEKMNGVYNAVAPNPISNKKIMLKLAKKICGKFYIPFYVPSFLLKLMMGDRSIEILKSTTVSSQKIEATGFACLYKSVDEALEDLA
jgi:uncharacterized protein (TIGR01777 family)